MRLRPGGIALLVLSLAPLARAQQTEAETGFDLQGTFSAMTAASTLYQRAPRDGSVVDGGFRLMLYPTWKLSRHWTFYGAFQTISRPYFESDFITQGHGVREFVNQGYLSYSAVGKNSSLQVKVGQLSSAFGEFPLEYDDRSNPLVDVPMQYGYYGSLATLNGLAGAEVDATWKKLDARAQFVNSSPANPRSIFQNEQYGSWAAGFGYTIRQGLRVGFSGYTGPYLDREFPFYFAAEGRPRTMPASAGGIDAQWGHGHWSVRGELQKFDMTYGAFPTFHEHTGYVEAQRTLTPRWYIATRVGYLMADYEGRTKAIEAGAAYRPGAGQLIKVTYETAEGDSIRSPERTLAIQFTTAIHPLAFAGH